MDNIAQLNTQLDRDKVLDNAIYYAICGLHGLKDGDTITSVVRLEIAMYYIQRAINNIKENKNYESKTKNTN